MQKSDATETKATEPLPASTLKLSLFPPIDENLRLWADGAALTDTGDMLVPYALSGDHNVIARITVEEEMLRLTVRFHHSDNSYSHRGVEMLLIAHIQSSYEASGYGVSWMTHKDVWRFDLQRRPKAKMTSGSFSDGFVPFTLTEVTQP